MDLSAHNSSQFHSCCEARTRHMSGCDDSARYLVSLNGRFLCLRYNSLKTCLWLLSCKGLGKTSSTISAVPWVLEFLRHMVIPYLSATQVWWFIFMVLRNLFLCYHWHHCIRQLDHKLFGVILILDGLPWPSSLSPCGLWHLPGRALWGEYQNTLPWVLLLAQALQGKV